MDADRRCHDVALRALLLVTLLVALVSPGHARAEPEANASRDAARLGLGAQMFFDDGSLSGERQVVVLTEDESYSFGSAGLFALSAWALMPLLDDIFVGGHVQYYIGGYETAPEDEEEGAAGRVRDMGQLLEVSGRGEWVIPVSDSFDATLGTLLGVVILFPGGELEDEIESLEEQGVGVLSASVPRLGYVVGPIVGARWKLSERLAVRGDLSLNWEQIFIFSTEESISGVSYRKDWRLDIIRYGITLGVELGI